MDEEDMSIRLRAAELQMERMRVRIQELEHREKRRTGALQEQISRLAHLEDLSRKLCMQLLGRDREEMKLSLDGHYSWNDLDTEELIRKAGNFFDRYIVDKTADMQKLQVMLTKALDRYNDISDQYASMKQNHQSVSLQCKEMIEGIIRDDNEELKKAFEYGEIKLEDEDGDKEENEKNARKMVAKIESTEKNIQRYKASSESESARKKQRRDKFTCEQIDSYTPEEVSIASKLSDEEKAIIECIGRYGHSLAPEVRTATGLSGRKFYGPLTTLSAAGIIIRHDKLTYPTVSTVTVIEMTLLGKQIYKILTGEYPAEAECEKLMRYHKGLEHGYGIRQCKLLLDKCKIFSYVDMFSKQIKIDGKEAYVPDIITQIQEDGSIEYFEYERGNQSKYEYFNKFKKMAMCGNAVNVIVPTTTDHLKMQDYMYEWAQLVLADKKGSEELSELDMRLVSYQLLEKRITEDADFDKWWYINTKLSEFPSTEKRAN